MKKPSSMLLQVVIGVPLMAAVLFITISGRSRLLQLLPFILITLAVLAMILLPWVLRFVTLRRTAHWPVVCQDELLGALRKNPSDGTVETVIPWCDGHAQVVFAPCQPAELQYSIGVIKQFVYQQTEWDKGMRAFAADRLLAERVGGLPGFDVESLSSCLSLDRIRMHHNGDYTYTFKGSGPLAGHTVDVLGTPGQGPVRMDRTLAQ